MLATALVLAAAPACAQSWTWGSAVSGRETVTNNVNLESSETRQSDWVTELTPSLHVTERGARTSLEGTLSVPIVLYARNGGNNAVYPSADLLGDVRLIGDIFHVEGQVSVAQQFFNPFGAQPLGFENVTQNRYQTSTYRVSPYAKGITPGRVSYEVRNDNVWTDLSGAPIATSNFRYTAVNAKLSDVESVYGWQAEADYNDTDYYNAGSTTRTALVRGIGVYTPDPQLRLSARVGYEENHFPLQDQSNAIYGAGFDWRPTARAKAHGFWEHRYFGPSYLLSLENRMPLTVWNVRLSRNVTTYPQALANLPAGADVSALLNQIYQATIPDPTERQQTIDQFIRDRGLPPTLTSALSLYSQQILLQESQSASVGLLGVRNTVLLTIFNVRSEPIAPSGNALPPTLAGATNNRQTGASVLWSHKFTPSLVLDTTIDRFRTVANEPFEGKTNQTAARIVLSSPLSAKTTVFAGARYQTLNSDVAFDYNETAAFIGFTHTFR
ncbi:MAG: TIGR03016 family PEP-CTERM system-associated outer membrane protein [Casimicrobiaceae bacterium]